MLLACKGCVISLSFFSCHLSILSIVAVLTLQRSFLCHDILLVRLKCHYDCIFYRPHHRHTDHPRQWNHWHLGPFTLLCVVSQLLIRCAERALRGCRFKIFLSSRFHLRLFVLVSKKTFQRLSTPPPDRRWSQRSSLNPLKAVIYVLFPESNKHTFLETI